MDIDKFQKIASCCSSCVVAVALIIGAIWAIYTFNSELRVQNAKAQLEKLNRDLAQEPKLEIDIEMQQLSTHPSKERIIIGKLLVTNIGTGDVVLKQAGKDKDDPPLHLYEVRWSKGHEDWKHVVSFYLPLGKDMRFGEMTVYAGLTNQARFCITVPRPGLYVLVFKIPGDNVELERAKRAGATLPDIFSHASNYILVK
jgi:hypothetical protein